MRFCNMVIDTTQRIAKSLYFPLTGVDSLQGKRLRSLFSLILLLMYSLFKTGVDLAAQILTG
jgi:hypothetical protein